MQKVKVNRYMSSKHPKNIESESSDENGSVVAAQEVGEQREVREEAEKEVWEDDVDDRRLRRLGERHAGGRGERWRVGWVIEEPEVIYEAEE